MLTEQVNICYPFESGYFQKIGISKLSKICEIGCGNGAFLKKISEDFPGPKYKGYDHCESLINIAKGIQNENIVFELGSANSIDIRYDLIILRLIIHQLNDRVNFLKELSLNLRHNAQVIIIEPYDDMFQLSVKMPAFSKHLAKHREILSPESASRDVQLYIEEDMKKYNFYLQEQFYYYVPSSLPEYREKYYRYMRSTCLIIGCGQDVLDEIEQWFMDPNSFVQIGLICYRFLKRE